MITPKAMIEIFPQVRFSKTCPDCHATLTLKGVLLPGMRTLAELFCKNCRRPFYADLPVGHGIKHAALIDGLDHRLFFKGLDWYPLLLKQTLESRPMAVEYAIETRLKNKPSSSTLIILNCLDTYYGHALLKLLNASYYLNHHPRSDLLVIVPQFLKWLVPARVSQVVSVNMPLRKGYIWLEPLNELLGDLKKRYSKIYLSKAFSLPNETEYDFKEYVKTPAFDLAALEKPQARVLITFIYREDRLWLRSHFLQKLVLFCQARGGFLKIVPWLLAQGQGRKINQLYRQLKKNFGPIDFAVAGLGRSVWLAKGIRDYRFKHIDLKIEKKLAQLYSRSAVVIGVHGSNMLIPSGLAGITLNLLPNFKLRNIAQDLILAPHGPRRLSLYRYRILPAAVSVKDLAQITYSCVRHFRNFALNSLVNTHEK